MPDKEEIIALLDGEDAPQLAHIVQMGQVIVPHLIEIASQHSDSLVAMRAIAVLGEIGGTAAATAIEEILQGEDDLRRYAAVQAIGRAKGVEATSTLIALLDDENSDITEAAIGSLASVGDATSLAALKSFKAAKSGDYLGEQASVAIKTIEDRIV